MDFEFNVDENVLLLAEGNFSFCHDLVRHIKNTRGIHRTGQFTNVFASCFENESRTNISQDVRRFLLDEGVHLIYGVDATNLRQNKCIRDRKFGRIIFNFPHIDGKMRIDLNRKLLVNFFVSCSSFLDEDGLAIVSLCEGQGGTPYDKPRRYDDTWKIVESGAAGGFLLNSLSPWPEHLLPNYRSIGFRGRERSFRTDGAVVHVFKKADPLDTESVPEDLLGLHEIFILGCGVLQVPLAYKRLLDVDPANCKFSILRHVQEQIMKHLAQFGCKHEGDLPLVTDELIDDSQIPCLLDGRQAYLRTSFEQVISETEYDQGAPRCYSGIIFRKMDNDFTSYLGSYQMLIVGCNNILELVNHLSDRLSLSRHSKWWRPLSQNACTMYLDLISLELFKDTIQSVKALWSPRIRCALMDQDGSFRLASNSLFPPSFTFDISFSSNGPLSDEPFHRLIHNLSGDLIESVRLQSRYSPEGSPIVYHCHRITYRSYDKPLYRSCVVDYQHNAVRNACETYLGVSVR